MRPDERKGRVLGRTAPVGHRAGYEVYEALKPDECWMCERTIGVGEAFTRHTVTGGGSRRWPICGDCADAEVVK